MLRAPNAIYAENVIRRGKTEGKTQEQISIFAIVVASENSFHTEIGDMAVEVHVDNSPDERLSKFYPGRNAPGTKPAATSAQLDLVLAGAADCYLFPYLFCPAYARVR